MLHRMVRWTMVGSVALAFVAFWQKDALPPASSLHQELLEEPVQAPVRRAALDTTVSGVQYRIQPRYSYELHGMVVSLHDADTWWDYAHREWGDQINVMDLCVVWGENVRREAYKGVSWSNDQWTCWWSTMSEASFRAFDPAAFSNNHLVTDDPAIARALRKARVGDQVRIRGYLADYVTYKNGSASPESCAKC